MLTSPQVHRVRNAESRQSATAAAAPMLQLDEEDEDDWTNDVFYQLDASDRVSRRRSERAVAANRRWPLRRVFILTFSLLIGLCGACIVFVCVSPARAHALIAICHSCTYLLTVGVAVGICLLTTSLAATLTVSTTRCWNSSISSTFVPALFTLYGGACFTVAAAALMLRFGNTSTKASMQRLWAEAVATRPSLVCDVEGTLACSGFEPGRCCVSAPLPTNNLTTHALHSPAPCFFVDDNGTAYEPSTLSVILWPSAHCPVSCVANGQYNRACHPPLEHMFTRTFTSLCTAFLAIGATFCFSAVVAYRHRTHAQRDEPNHDADVQRPFLSPPQNE